MTEGRCALLSAEQHEALLGTAPEASALLLLEVRCGWAAKILESELPEPVRASLAALEASTHGLRLQFIRAPRRAHGPLALYLCRVGETLMRMELGRLDDVTAVDVAQWLETGAHPGASDVATPLTLVCTHGRRDVCCALQGKPVYEALCAASAGDAGSADAGGGGACEGDGDSWPTVWQTSHLGGHRFAPVVLSLPDGHCYGRVDAGEAAHFLRAQRAKQVHSPARLRGCTANPAWLQAASVAWRMATDERAFGAVLPGARVDALDRGAQLVTLSTTRGGVRVEVRQQASSGPLRPASCGDAPSPVVSWGARVLD